MIRPCRTNDCPHFVRSGLRNDHVDNGADGMFCYRCRRRHGQGERRETHVAAPVSEHVVSQGPVIMKMVIAIRKDLGMSRGKLVAQGAHAAVGALLEAQKSSLMGDYLWFEGGQEKVVVSVDSEEALLALEAAALKLCLPHYLVRDRGKTEVDPGTATAIAIGPADDEDLEPLTGPLKLYC